LNITADTNVLVRVLVATPLFSAPISEPRAA
jgi:hypothetical protein